MVRVGIIGLGFMGRTHWRCYNKLADRAQVVAVADIDLDRVLGDSRDNWGNLGGQNESIDFSQVAGTTNWREVISRSDLDIVDICVPTPYHAEIAIAAMAVGKHVLCEKPLARSVDEARLIADAAAQSTSFFMPAMCMRFWPQWSWLKEVVADGRYGRVKGATFVRQGGTPPGWYRNGAWSGGALLDLHIHDTDYICYLFGPPRAVSSCGYRAVTDEYDEVATHYWYDGGPMVAATGGWAFANPFPFRMRYTVTFEDGVTADFDLGRADPLIVYDGTNSQFISCEPYDGWYCEIRYFVECVARNQRPNIVSAADGLQSLRVAAAEARSIVSGQRERV